MYSLLVSSEAPCHLRVYSRLPRLQSQVPKYICTYSGLYLFILNSMYCQVTQRTYTHTHSPVHARATTPSLKIIRYIKEYLSLCQSANESPPVVTELLPHVCHRHGLSRCCGVLKTSAFLIRNLRVRT